MWDFSCPICKSENCVLPVGPKNSPILIIGDHPGKDEIKEGKCFVGPTGGVLRSELAKVGVDMRSIRVTNLWHHEPNRNKACLDYGAKKAIEESKSKKVIMLIGSDTLKYFCDKSVEEWNGLEVTSDWFPDAKVLACIQPATVFHGGLGEIRFALKSFADLMHKEKLI